MSPELLLAEVHAGSGGHAPRQQSSGSVADERAAGGSGAVASGREGSALTPDKRTDTLRLLIVDDERSIRTLLRAVVARDDRFELVGEAADGDEAIELAADLQPDAILLDLLMPRMGGREALPELLQASPRSMVLVLSALSAIDEAEATFAAGAFAYLEKSLLGPGLMDELYEQHRRFARALHGETVWAENDPPRIRR